MAESNIPCRGIGTIGYYCLHACEQYVNWLLAVLVYTYVHCFGISISSA